MATKITQTPTSTVELTLQDILLLLQEHHPGTFSDVESISGNIEIPYYDHEINEHCVTSKPFTDTNKITLNLTHSIKVI